MNPRSPEGRPLLLDLLRHTIGANVTVESSDVVNRYHDYVVLRVQLANPASTLIVKLAGPNATIACPFDRTAASHNLVSQNTTVPVAHVIAADVSYARWPWRYLIMDYIPGIEWAELAPTLTEEQRQHAYTLIAQAVAGLHSIRFAQFGGFPFERQAHTFRSFTHALHERARKRIAQKDHAAMFAKLLDERAGLFSGVTEPALCHEDLHKHNILFRPEGNKWNLAAILDFDSAWVGSPESDLARIEMWYSGAVDFLHDYRTLRSISSGYAERRPIYQLLWCLEYAANTPEHLADTRRLCTELGLPPIEGFAPRL
ncbi:MAG: phosphotransferase [Chloroflexota bacterium]